MPGGKGKIDEYNKSLTPEQRVANARYAASQKRPGIRKAKTIRELAKLINDAPAQKSAKASLKKLGLENDADMTNAALITAAIFRAAFDGNMAAVDKWLRFVGQDAPTDSGNGKLAELIDGLKEPEPEEPNEDDLYSETAESDDPLAEEQTPTN